MKMATKSPKKNQSPLQIKWMLAQKQVKLEVAKRLAVQASLKESLIHHKKLLRDSLIMQEQLRHLSRQILLAQEEERKQISRELHDEVSQVLTGIKIRLATLTLETAVNSKGIKKKIAGAQKMVAESVNIVHRFARNLRPALLDDLGLVPALHSYMKSLSHRTGLKIQFKAFSGIEKISVLQRTTLFRVAQSALNNVSQHAVATEVKVTFTKTANIILMEISDNGKAFDAERILRSARPRRLGLLSMRERVEMIGGTFSVISSPGKGTTISASIPVKQMGN